MNFIDRVTNLRKEKGVTEKQVLIDCGLSKNSFGNWKKGMTPAPAAQKILANYFGVTVDYLMGKTNNPIPHSGQIKAYLPYEKRGVRPIIGMASAGTGVIAEEMILGWQAVDEQYDNDNFFWLRIAGDSMSPKIDDGDLVLIQRDAEIEHGNVVVALIDNSDGLVKQVLFEENTIILHSFNPYYPDLIYKGKDVERVRFIGRARKVERDL